MSQSEREVVVAESVTLDDLGMDLVSGSPIQMTMVRVNDDYRLIPVPMAIRTTTRKQQIRYMPACHRERIAVRAANQRARAQQSAA